MDFLLLYTERNFTKSFAKFLCSGFPFTLKGKELRKKFSEVFVKWISFYFLIGKELHKKFGEIFVKWISFYFERKIFSFFEVFVMWISFYFERKETSLFW